MQHHNYRLEELDTLIPWEKEIYTTLLLEYLKEEELRQKQRNGM
jgi:hypothetical protein